MYVSLLYHRNPVFCQQNYVMAMNKTMLHNTARGCVIIDTASSFHRDATRCVERC